LGLYEVRSVQGLVLNDLSAEFQYSVAVGNLLTLTDLKVLEVRAVGMVTEGNVWVCEVRDFLEIVSRITEIL
jgi:hypothetical protein